MKVLESNPSKKLLLLAITGILSLSCLAQGPVPRSDFWSNVRFGGGLGLGFGNDSFSIAVAPAAIYEFSPQFATGLGLQFNYSEFDQSNFTSYGAGVMTYFTPIPAIQFSAEFEEIRVSRDEEIFGVRFEEDYWSPALFLGIGFGNRNVMAGIRYDVLYDDDKSIYADPWIPFVRVFF